MFDPFSIVDFVVFSRFCCRSRSARRSRSIRKNNQRHIRSIRPKAANPARCLGDCLNHV